MRIFKKNEGESLLNSVSYDFMELYNWVSSIFLLVWFILTALLGSFSAAVGSCVQWKDYKKNIEHYMDNTKRIHSEQNSI